MRPFLILVTLLAVLSCSLAAAAEPGEAGPLVVHEWGTFTTLQDSAGRELPGINIDDEPVPDFVHNLEPHLLDHPLLSQDFWSFRQKGTPRHHPLVLMRLETPVVYFYPPRSATLPLSVDVDVRFRGGWLTEFYPAARSAPDTCGEPRFEFRDLSSKTLGRLNWSGLKIGADDAQAKFPATDERVWLAPRQVASTPVTTVEGESEQYLFYRGVAHLRAPLSISTSRDGEQIHVRGNFQEVLGSSDSAPIHYLWLVETRASGDIAFRQLDPIVATADPAATLLSADRRFGADDFSSVNRQRLEAEMHRSLMAEGLFADEAKALLTTWQRAYFASPGLRVFFTVPRVWTDHYLPLSISGSPELERVMIGRVELISDSQRDALSKLARMKSFSNAWIHKLPEDSPAYLRLLAGRTVDPQELGANVPPEFHLYLGLGRFRNALVTAEQRSTGNQNLAVFMDAYGLRGYRVGE